MRLRFKNVLSATLFAAAGLAAFAPTCAAADARPAFSWTESDSAKNPLTLRSPDKEEKKPSAATKKTFKDFRLGQCSSGAAKPPNTSWPARGDTAISICR